MDLLVFVALALAVQQAEATVEQMAEASVVGREVLHHHTWSLQLCRGLEELRLAKLDHYRRPSLHHCDESVGQHLLQGRVPPRQLKDQHQIS